MQIAKPLSAEDCQVQAMADASPIKWHLAHTTWFFETFLLGAHSRGYKPLNEAYKYLFNSYYNGVGDKHPRPERGLLSRPSLEDVLDYRAYIDTHFEPWLTAQGTERNDIVDLVLLGFNHEQQHQELMLTDLKYMLSVNPLTPIYAHNAALPLSATQAMTWLKPSAGLVDIGFDQTSRNAGDFCFDNELPRHQALLHPYQIASRLATNAEYLEFMNDGGYRDHALWLADGWDWVQRNGISSPLYWRGNEAGAKTFTLRGELPLDLSAPVSHVSFFEADAFARWTGARLPTEFEWEHAAASVPLEQAHGALWQWTASAYLPYPGFSPARGAVGEYNGKFMNGQYVLRGSSVATPVSHGRNSYRNFFQPDKRWQFTGIRLAK
jgi:ergothioneine biosynthesis protein EgtB